VLSRTLGGLALLALSIGASARAGAADSSALFEQWEITDRDYLPRVTGMGGAFIGISDGLAAAVLSPAELALVVPKEGTISSAGASLAVKLGKTGIAAYAYRPAPIDLFSDGTTLQDGQALEGRMRLATQRVGLAAGHPLLHDRVRVGAGFGLATTRVRGGYSLETLGTPIATRWGVDERAYGLSAQASAIWDVLNHAFYGNTLRIGAAIRKSNFLHARVDRTIVDIGASLPPTVRDDSPRLPETVVASVGAVCRTVGWTIAGQADTWTADEPGPRFRAREWAFGAGIESSMLMAGVRARLGVRRERERILVDDTLASADRYSFHHGDDHVLSYAVGLSWQRALVKSLKIEPALHVDAVTLPRSFRIVAGTMLRF
jgi:hypothetical protein